MKRFLSLAFVLLLAGAALAAEKRAFTIEDFYRVRTASDLSLSKDGRMLAWTVTAPDLPHAKRTQRIWIADAAGSNARERTHGDADTSARFAPDGRSIVFIRSGNLWMLPLEGGGEARQVTDISTGVSDPLFSPDGKWIAFSTGVYPECNGDDACNKRIADRWSGGKLKAHMADSLLFRHWTAWRDGTVTHVWLANVENGETRDVTPGRSDFPIFQVSGSLNYDFSPDGRELAVASKQDPEQASSTNADVWLISITDPKTAPRNITAANKGWDGGPRYSPDGRFIAYRTQKDPGYESSQLQLALYDRAAGTSRILAPQYDNWIEDAAWADDSRSLVVSSDEQGRNPISRVDVASGALTKIFEDRTIDSFEVAGGDIFYIGRSVGEPTEVFRAALAGGAAQRQRISHLNDQLASEVDIRPAEVMWVTGAEGARVQVFIVKPHGFDPAKKYPLILNVHGGPQQQWADSFRGDWQVYPGQGYVVAFPNPHGSTGFGQAYTAAISGDWGGKPFEDLMRVTDALEKLPYVDRNRMGAMRWSYGGYMMNWFEGHTDRFKAIASMMGLFDLRSFYGATEELWFPEWDLKGQPWNSELYQKWSPSNFVKNFKTPCLVITGERDYRVPYTQSLELFTALQKMKVPSRLIVYSEAGHWPSWYEMALYYTAHLEWFQKYLGGGGPPWSTEAYLRNAVFDASGKRIEPEKEKAEVTQGKPDVKPQ